MTNQHDRRAPRRQRSPVKPLLSVLVVAVLVAVPGAAVSAAPGTRFVGPLLSRAESSTISWGRDGAFSVPLPNGKLFWVFGDTPRYRLSGNRWYMNAFITGSTAGLGDYTPGQRPTARFNEINLGKRTTAANQPKRFMSEPKYKLPDGSGRACTRANVVYLPTEAVRWPTGAALMPDGKNVLITYVGVCAVGRAFRSLAWGFALYNWQANRFSTPPTDVFPAADSGAPLAQGKNFGSPVIADGKVTLYSWPNDRSTIYATSVPADLASLQNQASYADQQSLTDVDGVTPTVVAAPSATQPNFTMVQFAGRTGHYQVLEASDPLGPWTPSASGTLPGCANRPRGPDPDVCFSPAIHPELSQPSRLLVTYFLPGYGPGIGGQHPFGGRYFGHVVMASLPD